MAQDIDEAYRRFTTGVGLITTHGSRGPNVMACEWTFNVSYEPFLISVHISPEEATHEAILESGEFGVNLVAEEQVAAMGFAGHFSKRETDKLSSEVFETYPGMRIKAPMIKGSLLNAECRLLHRSILGDHTAFVGEVVDFSVDSSRRPVVLHRGARRLGPRIKRRAILSVAVTPMKATPGATLKVVGELRAPKRASKPVAITILDREGEEVALASTRTGAEGYFQLAVELPPSLRPGGYVLVAKYRMLRGRARLQVE